MKHEALIATQIIKARHAQKMSQQDLADAIGVAKSTIGRIESGLTSPKATTLYKISKVLGKQLVIDGSTIENNGEQESDKTGAALSLVKKAEMVQKGHRAVRIRSVKRKKLLQN